VAGEVVIQLSRTPTGPVIAGGKPAEFEWDEKNSAVRLAIPAGGGPLHRVRIGLATEPPETSAFFGGPSRLIIGRPNIVSTSYSSEALASRSRLLAPPGFHLKPIPKSPLEIRYEVTVPGMRRANLPMASLSRWRRSRRRTLGRTRMQLFPAGFLAHRRGDRPAPRAGRASSARPAAGDLRSEGRPGVAPGDPEQLPVDSDYTVEISGKGLTFLPSRFRSQHRGATEREMAVRVFPTIPRLSCERD